MNLGKKNKKENHIFHLNGLRPRFSAHGRSRPASALARSPARAPRPTGVRPRPPRGRRTPAMAYGWHLSGPCHSTRSPSPARPCHAPHLPLHSASRSTAAEHARARLRHRPRRASPKLARPATTARRRPLHLASSSASTSRTPCSRPFALVSFPSSGIAHRSELLLVEVLRSVDIPSSIHLLPSLHAHEHRPGSVELPRRSPSHPMAGDALPLDSRAVVLPCMPARSPPCTSGHARCTAVSALARWSRWW